MGLDYRPLNVAASYRHCQLLTRRAAANFYPAFLILPRLQQRAMMALYAYARLTDDLADEPGDVEVKARELRHWRARLSAALAGGPSDPIHPALADAVWRFRIPPQFLFDVIDGVETDLRPTSFDSFDDLVGYCYRVAGAVGLACIHIWGFQGPTAESDAEAAGIAFQLTNILRDLAEDRANGRVYLPADELRRFGCDPTAWRADCPRFAELMRFQVARARSYFARGRRLNDALPPAGRAVFGALLGIYEGILNEIEARRFDVFAERVRLRRRQKAALMLRALPVRWGWA
ncbi:MAG TPA: squalene/phytoene synthase family protein [Gemmataceae bacterium]|nr:squalene/phytoene synthase family protein [Gemmataceae bacterium]